MSCPCVPPRHALCVKTQGHRDAQGRSLGNALEMAKKLFPTLFGWGGMNYNILHYVLHYSLQPRDAQGRSLRNALEMSKNDFQHFLAGGGMNYSILHYVLHYSLQPRDADAQGRLGTQP